MLNVVFNIYNKKVLNVFPYPWLTSMISLDNDSLIMLVFWAARVTEPPKTDLGFWKSLTSAPRFGQLVGRRPSQILVLNLFGKTILSSD
ncbi:hypothetical protein ZIOFF_057933 [Zingiber officinale]|uniref:Sugar phosphate transporter domain-containing protein n=1 Tax=Zingiber officinale TaxID=94328 RepID=A0A8J5KC62_ZINOF|nr:hypothetical protein ZIOFF_057933 [Zingiber officinale]